MFKIDLLNGAGLPPRSHPLLIAAATLACVVLGIVAAFDGVHVYDVGRQIASQKQSLAMYDRKITELADVAKTLEAGDKRASDIRAGLAEVTQLLGTHRTWSGPLEKLTNNAKGLTISEIVAKREEKRNIPQKGVYDYTLVMGIVSPAGAAPVESLIQALRLVLPLRSGDNIGITSQRILQINGRDVQYYLIECRLK